MSLRRALERLPQDRVVEGTVRELLAFFHRRQGEWIHFDELPGFVGQPLPLLSEILEILVDTFVLDFERDSDRYRYHHDRVGDLEIERYFRRADQHAGFVQENVARFRKRYHGM